MSDAEEIKDQKLILVVDDNNDITNLVKMMLPYKGFRVLSASCSKEIIEVLEENPGIQLILMDMLLCGENGIDISSDIKKNANTAHIPVLLMSAHGDAKQFVAEGYVEGFIEKPFGLDEMIEKINSLLPSASTGNPSPN